MLNTSINAGAFRGRKINLPPQGLTRAVSAKVRGAIFNKLDVSGKKVLDLFAGGGTLGFEAISMGADTVTFVDRADRAIKVIYSNAEALGVRSNVEIIIDDAMRFKTNTKFDIVFMDPPYDEFDESMVKGVADLVQLGGILVVSCSRKTNFDVPIKYDLLDQKLYGDTKITYLRKTN